MLISTAVCGEHAVFEMVEKNLEGTDFFIEPFEARGWTGLVVVLSVDWGRHSGVVRGLEEKSGRLKDGEKVSIMGKIEVNYEINLEKWYEMLYDVESNTWSEVDGLYT